MNRQERRRQEKKGKPVEKDKVVNIKLEDLEKIKADAAREAANVAFTLMMGLPVTVLRDKFGWGRVRIDRFMDRVLDLYDSFERGYVSLEDIKQDLWDIGQIEIQIRR